MEHCAPQLDIDDSDRLFSGHPESETRSQGIENDPKDPVLCTFCSAHFCWSRVVLVDFDFFGDFGIVRFSGFRTSGLAKRTAFQTNLGMHLNPLAPSGSTHVRTFGATKAL